MIVRCRPEPYIDRVQLIIGHLHRLMMVRYKYCTIPSSASRGAISKLKLGGHLLQYKVIMPSQRQCKYCEDAETIIFYFSHDGVSLKYKIKHSDYMVYQYG
jgi:hypothetical protein